MDGAELAVLSHKFDGIAREMSNVLLRTGRSGVLNRAKDLSCCIVSAKHELLSTAESLPIHVLSGPDIMAKSMAEFHPILKRGDAFLHNSPYHGCSHAADHTILVPVIDDEGRHRFTVLAKAHQADTGNSIPTTYFAAAEDVYHEGALLFPAVKVQDQYTMVEDIVRMCELRLRVPAQWKGDFLAMLGAARTGERALLKLAESYGWDYLETFAEEWLNYGERAIAEVIADLPAGKSTASSKHDAMPGTPADGLLVNADIEVKPAEGVIVVDLTRNPDCIPSGLNLSEACARSAALLGTLNSLGKDIPRNGGTFRRIDIHLRENCVVGIPRHPTSCSVATTNIADRATAAVQLAFSKLQPGLGMAEVGAINPPHKGVISGTDPRTEERFINQLFLGSTGGAGTPKADAWLTYSHVGNGALAYIESIEMAELHHPILIWRRKLVQDSEGPGQFRGAPALEVAFEPVGTNLTLIYASDGVTNAAKGAQGGGDGAPATQKIERNGRTEPLPNVARIDIKPGEVVVSSGTGGGGYGAPARRDPSRILQDLRDGIISKERARFVYGIAEPDALH